MFIQFHNKVRSKSTDLLLYNILMPTSNGLIILHPSS